MTAPTATCPADDCGATVSATLYGFHYGRCPYCDTEIQP